MNPIRQSFRALLLAAALLLGLASPAFAGDKVTLKDGRVFEGTITREDAGYVWIKVSSGGMEMFFSPEQVAKVEHDEAGPKTPDPAAAPKKDVPSSSPRKSGVPRIAIITLGEVHEEMVGVYITAQSLKDIVPALEEEHVTDVVFKIYSGGGYAIEPEKISDVIEEEYKTRFRTVAWIESAISAAAMSMHCIEEIYFMPQGNYGACTMWSGQLVAAKGRQLEGALYLMERISQRGHYDPKIMHSMQVDDPLSVTFDADGKPIWSQDESGEFIVNKAGQILTFNAATAEKFKFSRGTARTHEELAKLMGYQEAEFVGESEPGIPWPVCKADEQLRKFRQRTAVDETHLRNYRDGYLSNIAVAQGTPKEDRGKFVGKARTFLDKIEAMVRNNPNMALVIGFGPDEFKEWLEEQHRILRELMK
jgi:hypothetical protein